MSDMSEHLKVISVDPEHCNNCLDEKGGRRRVDLISSGCFPEDTTPESLVGKTVIIDCTHPYIELAEGVRLEEENNRRYTADFALEIAELWDAGKMIGGDTDEVIFALMDEVKRLRYKLNFIDEKQKASTKP